MQINLNGIRRFWVKTFGRSTEPTTSIVLGPTSRVPGCVTSFENLLIKYRRWVLGFLAVTVLILEYQELRDHTHATFALIFEISLPLVLLVVLYTLLEVLIRLVNDERAAVKLVELKHRLSMKLSSIPDWDELKQAALEEMADLIHPRYAALFIRNYGEDTFNLELEWTAAQGTIRPICEQFLPLELACSRSGHDWLHPTDICGFKETEFVQKHGAGYFLPFTYGDEYMGQLFFQMEQGTKVEPVTADILNSTAGDISVALNSSFQRKLLLDVKMAEAASAERTSVSRDLHDSLSQNLGYIRVMLEQMVENQEGKLISCSREDLVRMHGAAQESYELVRMTLKDLRTIKSTVSVLIQTQAKAVAERKNMVLKYMEDGPARILPHDLMLQTNLIIGEALSNISRHSEAKNIEIHLTWQDCLIIIQIKDDGKGFDPAAVAQTQHFGMAIMRERIETMKGYFDLKTSPGNGTEIVIQIPVPE